MTRINRETMLHITDMGEDLSNVSVRPDDEDPVILLDQDDDRIILNRDGARALGEFLLEWATPKQDDQAADPISCGFCEMEVTAGQALGCRKPGCPAKDLH